MIGLAAMVAFSLASPNPDRQLGASNGMSVQEVHF
jgi:hypothetical protein